MNERIRELAIEAGYSKDFVEIGLPGNQLKFAQLIVQECIEQIQLSTARDPQTSVQYRQSVGHIHRIRQHFGVQE